MAPTPVCVVQLKVFTVFFHLLFFSQSSLVVLSCVGRSALVIHYECIVAQTCAFNILPNNYQKLHTFSSVTDTWNRICILLGGKNIGGRCYCSTFIVFFSFRALDTKTFRRSRLNKSKAKKSNLFGCNVCQNRR